MGQLYIFQYVQGEDGTNWGKTDTDGVTQGWLNLDRDTRTSCCRNIRCYISLRNGTGRSGCKDMDTPMSLYHKSFHEARSVDVFRSLSRFRHSMQ